MTVAELIEELRKYDGDMPVLKLFHTMRGDAVTHPEPHIRKVDSIRHGDYHIPRDDDYYADAVEVEALCI